MYNFFFRLAFLIHIKRVADVENTKWKENSSPHIYESLSSLSVMQNKPYRSSWINKDSIVIIFFIANKTQIVRKLFDLREQ